MGRSPDLEPVLVPSGEQSQIEKKTQMARVFEEEQEVHKSAGERAGLKTIKKSRVTKKTTTITKGENEKPASNELVEKFRLKLGNMHRELNELECRLDAMAPIANDRKTVRAQITEMHEFIKCVDKARANLDRLTQLGNQIITENLAADPNEVRTGLRECREQLDRIDARARKRLSDLEKQLDKLEKMRAMEKFRLQLDELRRKLNALESELNSMAPVASDKQTLLKQLREIKDFLQRLHAVKDEISSLGDFGERIIADGLALDPREIRNGISELKELARRIEDKANKRLRDIENALRKTDAMSEAERGFTARLDKLRKEIDELERRLDSMEPVGNDLETLRKQLREMEDFDNRLKSVKAHYNDVAAYGEQLIRDGLIANPQQLRDGLKECADQLARIEKKAAKRLRDIEDAIARLERVKAETDKFNLRLDAIRRKLDELEHRLDSMAPVANDRPTLLRQLDEMKDFVRRLDSVRDELAAVTELGERLIHEDLAADPRAIRDGLRDCQNQLNRLYERARKRIKDIEDALSRLNKIDEATAKFNLLLDAIRRALEELKQRLDSMAPVANDRPTLLRQLDEILDFIKRLDNLTGELDRVNELGEQLIRDGLAADPRKIRDGLRECKDKLAALYERARKRQKDIEDALKRRDAQDSAEAEWKRAAKELADWLDNARQVLMDDENVGADIDTVNVLVEQHKSFKAAVDEKQLTVDEIKRKGAELLANSPSNAAAIREILLSISNKSNELQRQIRDKSDKLGEARQIAAQLHNSTHSLLDTLAQAESALRASTQVKETDLQGCVAALESLEKVSRKLDSTCTQDYENIQRTGRNLLARPHPDGEPVLKHWLHINQQRFVDVGEKVKARMQRLTDVVQLLKETLSIAEDLIAYLSKHEARLASSQSSFSAAPKAKDKLDALLAEHKSFVEELAKRDSSVDKVVRVFSCKSQSSEASRTITQTVSKNIDDREYLLSNSNSLQTAANNETATSFVSYKDGYPEVCHSKAKIMLEKWRSVWQLSIDRTEMIIKADSLGAAAGQHSQQSFSGSKERASTGVDDSGIASNNLIQAELNRLNAAKIVHHAGNGMYKVGNAPRLVKLRTINGKVLVKINKSSSTLEDFLRTHKQQPMKVM